ncbi:Sas10/Utp3 family protein [Penicillium digitatum]|uniref:Sas10/Utp3 family protein n=3 Tax=Penicillium digitatum TaxID=36651 RepID=K9GRX9_PEND2|nr:Sas10/Utp3 family protein [Penicillium digitatum Pd1]EKV17368.1 Sas10/Utp3 family protein [Penicillium digitatum PHI26]EKV17631.1 Sas10/Utp3 family protein [Penicillium digitatum Pd1]QQK46858.1 Sas10/Utp3 family protein [Penicillium digitatum]
MGSKKRKAGRPAQSKIVPEPSKFDIEERFEDSEDDFQSGRDQILLEEGPEAKRRRRVAEEEELIQPSDEEILGYESADEDDDLEDSEEEDEYDDMGQPKGGAESEEEDEGIAAWGSSKKDLYNADQIETEVDALEEEQEAKRLQLKQLQAMNEADFGFDESEWVESGKGTEDGADAGVVTEVLPQLEITEDMDTDEKLKILTSRYPEFEPLAKDFVDLQSTFEDLRQAASKASSTDDDSEEPQPSPVPVVKFRALSAYLGTISMYFMLLSSPSPDATSEHVPMTPAELRQHPVMGSLVKFRKLWNTVKDLEELEEPAEEPTKETTTETTKAPKTQETKKPKQKKLSKAEVAQAEAEALRAERLRQTEAGLADLENLATQPSRKRKTPKIKAPLKDDDSDFGDEDALTAYEAEEKAKQKRSLRFYTSQLAQKANKRNAAGRDAGGDADLPYRERLRDRQARLNAEAEKRGRKELNPDQQLGGDSDDEDRRVAKELRRGEGAKEGTDDDEYYDMVASRSKKRKDDKQARAEAHAEAERLGGKVYEQEEIGPDGKRAITYQIQKNKGLHAKRSKDSRNPRVKKRKKYEEKKKKLGSTKQLYKGGEGRGGYGGELTGIKKNLVKSVKL